MKLTFPPSSPDPALPPERPFLQNLQERVGATNPFLTAAETDHMATKKKRNERKTMPDPPDNHGLGSPTHQLSNTKTPSCEPGEAPWRNTSRRDTTQGPSHHTVAALPFPLSSPITTTPTPPSLPAVTGADPPVATLRRALWAIDRVWRGWQAGHDAPTPPRRAVCHDNKSAPCSKKKDPSP